MIDILIWPYDTRVGDKACSVRFKLGYTNEYVDAEVTYMCIGDTVDMFFWLDEPVVLWSSFGEGINVFVGKFAMTDRFHVMFSASEHSAFEVVNEIVHSTNLDLEMGEFDKLLRCVEEVIRKCGLTPK